MIEAIVEDLAVKRALFAALEAVVARDAILATNTSSLSVAAIGGGVRRTPERVVGMHFFNPAPVMPLVEIVPAITTAPEVAERTRALVDGVGQDDGASRPTRRASSSIASRGRSTARRCASSRKASPTSPRSTGRCARSADFAWDRSS